MSDEHPVSDWSSVLKTHHHAIPFERSTPPADDDFAHYNDPSALIGACAYLDQGNAVHDATMYETRGGVPFFSLDAQTEWSDEITTPSPGPSKLSIDQEGGDPVKHVQQADHHAPPHWEHTSSDVSSFDNQYTRQLDLEAFPSLQVGVQSFPEEVGRHKIASIESQSDAELVKSHIKRTAGLKFICDFPECRDNPQKKGLFSNMDNAKAHVRREHFALLKQQPYMCLHSGCMEKHVRFTTRSAGNRHANSFDATGSKSKKYICSDCGKLLGRKDYVKSKHKNHCPKRPV